MKILFSFLLSISFNFISYAQVNYKVDTLHYAYRIGGSLDSVDRIMHIQSNTLPGGGWNSLENTFTSDFWFRNTGGMQFYDFNKVSNLRFSGLPHIGFAYSFGSSGTQFAQTEYQQQLKNGLLINLDYNKLRSNGMLRSGGFDHNNVALQLYRPSNFWSTHLSGTYASSNISLNDGLLIDTLNNVFDLQFIPIRKEEANVLTQRTMVDWWNYFDLYKDSTRALGFYVNNNLKIKKFVYSEQSDSLAQMYNQINLDSTQTYDQFQSSNTGLGLGAFFLSKYCKVTTGIDLIYWNFQNLGLFRDTVEINLMGDFKSFSNGDWNFQDSISYNIYGAQKSFYNKLWAHIYLSNNWSFTNLIVIDNKLGDYHQRYAYGNNYSNSFDSLRQYRFLADNFLEANFSNVNFRLGINYNFQGRNFWFINDSWNNDSLIYLNFYRIYSKLKFTVQKFSSELFYQFTYLSSTNSIQYAPKHLANFRLSYKTKVFKAGKMQVYTGFDFAFVSRYERIGFLPHVLSWDVSNSFGFGPAYTNLHWFGGFQIDEFRFFVRAENIGSFWTDRNIEIQNGYPIGGLQLRVGITWDFFN
jgi:hypothetical protein